MNYRQTCLGSQLQHSAKLLTVTHSHNFTNMDEVKQRADIVDQRLADLNKTLSQLQQALPLIKASNSNLNTVFEPKGGPLSNDDYVLKRSDAIKILTQLKGIKNKVLKYEKERIQEKQCLAQVRDKMRTELLAIKKEIMIDNCRQTPQQFRSYLTSQLVSLKQELIKVQALNDKNKNKNKNINGVPLNGNNINVLNKVKTELIGIRKEMAQKLNELKQLQNVQQDFERFKNMVRDKLVNLKKEVQEYENELNRVQQENDEFRKGNRIPKLLQDEITSKLNRLKENVFQVETENKTFRMQLNNDDPLLTICKELYVTTVDMHTGGEPLRIIENGIPKLSGSTLLEKRQNMIKNLDYYRKFLMHEPRGHFDMYGVIITEPDDKTKADFGVLFMHNEGYSSMCGHAVIALGRYAIDFGLLKDNKIKNDANDNDEKKEDNKNNKNISTVRIQCPCGIVTVNVEINDKTGKSTGNVSFISAPGWAEYISTSIQLDQFGKVEIDIGYGGAYYAICPSTRFNLNVRDSPIDDLINISTLIKQTVIKKLQLSHPDSKDLQFLYGTILTDGMNDVNDPTSNVCVFADRQVDRCPTGSGVIARLAIDYAKKNIKIGQKRQFIGKTGSIFEGEIVKVLQNYKDKKNAVIVKVTGSAKYVGRSQFYLEEGDELGRGFLMK